MACDSPRRPVTSCNGSWGPWHVVVGVSGLTWSLQPIPSSSPTLTASGTRKVQAFWFHGRRVEAAPKAPKEPPSYFQLTVSVGHGLSAVEPKAETLKAYIGVIGRTPNSP